MNYGINRTCINDSSGYKIHPPPTRVGGVVVYEHLCPHRRADLALLARRALQRKVVAKVHLLEHLRERTAVWGEWLAESSPARKAGNAAG